MYLKNRYIIQNIKKNPSYSIITVIKNDQKNISNTIKSIINQNFKNFEYIIIDGKSEDQTLKKIFAFKKKINILISENDKGIYYAMNKGIKLARGKIIVFVNSGDLLRKTALDEVNKIFQKNSNYDYVFGTVKRHYTKSTILKSGLNINRLKYNFDFATSHSTGFFLKKKIFKKYGLFNTKFQCSSDYDLYYRLILKKKIMGGATKRNKIIGIVRSGGYSSSVSFLDHIFEEAKIRLNNNQNILIVLLIFINAFIKGILKKISN